MNKPLVCHFLIGIPGSGKSRFAQLLAPEIDAVIVSTDEIREQLYSDAATQGVWTDIEAEVLRQIQDAVTTQQSVIYDATNAMREWRLDFLHKTVHLFNIQWIGWHLNTSVEVCKQRNLQRDRQVPDEIIEQMNDNLKQFPPQVKEGLLTRYSVPVTGEEFDREKIKKNLNDSNTILKNQANINSQIIFHKYSYLLDFERLMHLLSVIINYPGIGNLSETEPETLKTILEIEELPEFNTSIAEICAVINKKYHRIYAQEEAIQKDLDWLEKNGFLGGGNVAADLVEIEAIASPYLKSHGYKDLERFQRLIKTIRFILNYPFLREENGKPGVIIKEEKNGKPKIKFRQTTIVKAMFDYKLFSDSIDIENDFQRSPLEHNFRKDIEDCLKPYQLLPNFTMKKGYFAGTGILSQYELNKLYQSLQSHSREKYFTDPLAAEIYDTFEQRLVDARLLAGEEPYPTRLIGTKSIVNVEKYQQRFEELEEAIKNGDLLEFSYVKGCAKWSEDKPTPFRGYPLQIVFHNIAWYLGYEREDGNKKGLLTFERIDRIRFKKVNSNRTRDEQKKSVEKLDKLYAASAGLYLGDDVNTQNQYLNPKHRKNVEVTVILYATEKAFKFICEGNQRFHKIKMSVPDWLTNMSYDEKIFDSDMSENLPPYQYTLQITLPPWSVHDIDLIRWISAWGKEVKVISPSGLVERIYSIGEGITSIYQDIKLIVCELESVETLLKDKKGSQNRFISIKSSREITEPQSVRSKIEINSRHICSFIINNSAPSDEQVKEAVNFIKEKRKESKMEDGLQFLIYAHSGINDASQVAIAIYQTLKQDNDLADFKLSLTYL